MLVLRACFGVKPVIMQQPSKDRIVVYEFDKLSGKYLGMQQPSKDSVVVDAFAKLSGNYLGKIVLPTKISSMFYAIRGVQRQGARLLPHHERPFEYLIFFLDGIEFPCVAHSPKMWFAFKQWMYTLFNKVTSKTRIDLVWQEDDSFAFNLIKHGVKEDGGSIYIRRDGPGLERHHGVLAFTHHPHHVYIRFNTKHDLALGTTNLGFLANMKLLRKLELHNMIVKSWGFADKLRVETLILQDVSIDGASLEKFRHLKHLRVSALDPLNPNFGFSASVVARLPRLGTLRLTTDDRFALHDWETNMPGFKVSVNIDYESWCLRASRTSCTNTP